MSFNQLMNSKSNYIKINEYIGMALSTVSNKALIYNID